MNRKQILDARIRFEPNQPIDGRLVWYFYASRNVRHGGGPVTTRKFTLIFHITNRSFSGSAVRRVSKRKKRQPVFLSRGMVDYLRSRLPPEALADCARAAMTPTMWRSPPTMSFSPLQGWGPAPSIALTRSVQRKALSALLRGKAPWPDR